MTSSIPEPALSAMDVLRHPPVSGLRPKDAAVIILIDRSAAKPKVLMGRRGSGQVFMPDLYVFPGGRRDPGDHALPFAADLHPAVLERLQMAPPSRMSVRRARALALAALRELCEETGIEFSGSDRLPDLSRLRYVARAVTPPGNTRRYDTRFFLAFCDETPFDLTRLRDTEELLDLRWLDIDTLSGLKLPRITQTVLKDVTELMAADPGLAFGTPVPFYFMRRGRFVRSRL